MILLRGNGVSFNIRSLSAVVPVAVVLHRRFPRFGVN